MNESASTARGCPSDTRACPQREREIVRAHQRYVTEIVEHFGLCPWARQARLERRVKSRVLLGTHIEAEAAARAGAEMLGMQGERGAAARLGAETGGTSAPSLGSASPGRAVSDGTARPVEVAFLILPGHTAEPRVFDALAADVQKALSQLMNQPMAVAAFHPRGADTDLVSPRSQLAYLRRSPDPTLQCMRVSSIEAVLSAGPKTGGYVRPEMLSPHVLAAERKLPLREQVMARNLRTIGSEHEAIDGVFASIVRTREASSAQDG